ncbi:unnamed protein product [Polarella glacialis]|uniref:Pentatricopeptide repeat-containing protein, chloroplastic n=1 Tax=Polarella glacialis TaxID=89957 RepID=A0A813KVF0_POLGL|nr:unnamed protein product [Polarella glacialis]
MHGDVASGRGGASAERWIRSLFLLRKLRGRRQTPDLVGFNAAVSSCERSSHWPAALALAQEASGPCGPAIGPDVITFNALISAYARAGLWQCALTVVHEMPLARLTPDTISFNSAASSAGRGEQWRCSLDLLQTLVGTPGLRPTCVTFAGLASTCQRNAQWQHALALLPAMRQDAVEPDLVALSSVMSSCERAGRWLQAVQLLGSAVQASCELDIVFLNAGLSACGRAVRWAEALDVLRWGMDQQALRPNPITCGSIVGACSRAGEGSRAWDLLRKLSMMPGLRAGVTAYNAAQMGKSWAWSCRLLESMSSDGVLPDIISLGSGIAACDADGGAWQVALWLLFERWTFAKVGLRPNVNVLAAAGSACGRAAQWEAALGLLLGKLRSLGLQADAFSVAAAVAACEQGEQWQGALQLLREQRQGLLEPGLVACNSALTACERGLRWEVALCLLLAAEQSALQPDIVSHSAAIAACHRGGQWDRALALLGLLKIRRLEPNAATCASAIAACEKAGKWRQAVSMLNDMAVRSADLVLQHFNAAISASAVPSAGCRPFSSWPS